MYDTLLCIIQSSFSVLKILCGRPPSQRLATTDLFTISIVLPFPKYHRVGIIQYVPFSDWFLSPSNMHLTFSMSFHGLIAHFFLALDNVPLSDVPQLVY